MQIVLSGNRVIAHGEDCFLAMGGTVICEETGKAYPNATIAEVDAIPADVDSVGYEYHAGVFVPCAPYGKTQKGSVMLSCDECGAPRSSDLTSENGGLHIPGVLTGAKMSPEVLSLLGMAEGNLADAFAALLSADIKIVTGQYTGTGSCGSANKSAITLPAPPIIVFIWRNYSGLLIGADISQSWTNGEPDDPVASVAWENSMLWVDGMSSVRVMGTNNKGDKSVVSQSVSVSGNTFTWYGGSASYDTNIAAQLNTSGQAYKYAALIKK